eukprot:TRINITY_DN30365_c0_g1_i1.p1 TRINITY_DN30365_c0_g1~~TRINITY_DN30365_c0_g1_i1.p1  ORF type:complete len:834 (+),score=187.03 TRINITY_DN30365_c0_g1_i1:71-2503(+)
MAPAASGVVHGVAHGAANGAPTAKATLMPEKAILPRAIDFVLASNSHGGQAAAAPSGNASAGDGCPVPASYLYPREKLHDLCLDRTTRRVGRGLRNGGNTCFLNSVVQVLTHTRPLQSYLVSREHSAACQAKSTGSFCATCVFERHVHEALQGSKSVVNPQELLRRISQIGGKQMRLGRQEDAHEFMLNLLDSCHRMDIRAATTNGETLPHVIQHTTMIHQLFGGYLRSQVSCLSCKYKSNTFDPFLGLSLEVQSHGTLEKALEGFTKNEKLAGKVLYRCKGCKNDVEATKRFTVHSLPPLLWFHLKRFEFGMFGRGKIAKHLAFSTSVDMARFTSKPNDKAVYRLYGVIVHSGHSAKSGHYFSFARHGSGTWYQFDDEAVRAVSEQVVLRQQAYVLFYEAASLDKEQKRGSSPAAATPIANGTNGSVGIKSVNGASGAHVVNGAERKSDSPAASASKVAAVRPLVFEDDHRNGALNGCLGKARGESLSVAPGDGDGAASSVAAHVGIVGGNPKTCNGVGTEKKPFSELVGATHSDTSAADTAGSPTVAVSVPRTAQVAAAPHTLRRSSLARMRRQVAALFHRREAAGEGVSSQGSCGSSTRRGAKRRRVAVVEGDLKPSSPADAREDRAAASVAEVAEAEPQPNSPATAKEDSQRVKRRRVDRAEDGSDGTKRGSTEERQWKATSYTTQYGLASVDTWDDDGPDEGRVDGAAFAEAQRRLQPPPQRRDQLDAEYDVGKRKHKPKKAKVLVDCKNAFDVEQQRRSGKASGGKGSGKGGGEGGKGKSKGKGKGKGKGKRKGKGKGKHNKGF